MKANEPVYPIKTYSASDRAGLTVRDYVAIEAMKSCILRKYDFNNTCDYENTAMDAYKMADAMIKKSEEK